MPCHCLEASKAIQVNHLATFLEIAPRGLSGSRHSTIIKSNTNWEDVSDKVSAVRPSVIRFYGESICIKSSKLYRFFGFTPLHGLTASSDEHKCLSPSFDDGIALTFLAPFDCSRLLGGFFCTFNRLHDCLLECHFSLV
jgi:hypothetical protein